MMSPARLHEVLAQHPFPGAVVDDQTFILTVDGFDLYYLGCEWRAGDRTIPTTWPAFDSPDDGDRVHAEIRRVLATLDSDRRRDVEAQFAKMTDAHAVVSQRLVGAQKEVAELDATIDELRTALESIAANVGLVGSDQWAVGAIVGKVGELSHELDAAIARSVKACQRRDADDALRSQLAVAVGLDGSASLALILDTVTRDRPGREISRLSGLLDVLAAPVAFGERRLSTAERAEWALRRWLAEGKECSARMAQLIEAEVYLDVLGVPAYAAVPSDDPGDASEALTLPERLRLHFAAR